MKHYLQDYDRKHVIAPKGSQWDESKATKQSIVENYGIASLGKKRPLAMTSFKGYIVLLAGLLLGCLLLPACSGGEPPLSAEKKREIANVLYNQQLYSQSAKEYEEYLSKYNLDAKEQGNIAYKIADIYFERLRDYENALAFYLKSKHLSANDNLKSEIEKKIVQCLERLNRSGDARQVIQQTSALDDSQKPVVRPGEVVAKIGDREITTGDLAFYINQMPPQAQQAFQNAENKRELLRQFVAQEVLYDAAKRLGLDEDKEVLEGIFQAKKALMTEKMLRDEIEKESNLDNYTNADVETYYQANKERYAEKDDDGKVKRIRPFNEVAQQAAQDFIQEKQQSAYQGIVERLMKAEKVVFYEDKIQ